MRDGNDAAWGEREPVLWLKSFDDRLQITSIVSDAEGNVLLARSGAQTQKLDPNGALLWSKSFGSLAAIDGAGHAYVAGTLTGTLDLGTEQLHSSGGTDVYVIHLDSEGNVVRGIVLGGPDDEDVLSLAVDSDANIVVSGSGLGTVKLDQASDVLWTKDFHGHVAIDSSRNVLLTGALVGSADFGGGVLTSRGGADVFVVKLRPTGEHLFSRGFGDTAELQQGQAIVVDRWDNVIVGGVFEGAIDFGGGVLASARCPEEVWCRTTGFLTKLNPQGRLLWSFPFEPMRALQGLASDSVGNIVFSGALPGGVQPYRIPFVAELDAAGGQLWRRAEWPKTGIGAGRGVTIDPCDNVLWSLSALPMLGSNEQPYVTKLSP